MVKINCIHEYLHKMYISCIISIDNLWLENEQKLFKKSTNKILKKHHIWVNHHHIQVNCHHIRVNRHHLRVNRHYIRVNCQYFQVKRHNF